MSSPLQIYFSNLKQQHRLDDIVVVEDRSPSSLPRRKVVMSNMVGMRSEESSSSLSSSLCEIITQPLIATEDATMKTHDSNKNNNNTAKPMPSPIRMKIAASSA
ncbi:unnamed protein product [Cylindrotheca closterium]|uniref:Uncharacterized protein n=1 Tax=Cylindrotheca closterium TaxID=2856 RepID=A0AAD2JJM9_9STRA|nr:unnamed protein product [Cylindrotheca closterium]